MLQPRILVLERRCCVRVASGLTPATLSLADPLCFAKRVLTTVFIFLYPLSACGRCTTNGVNHKVQTNAAQLS